MNNRLPLSDALKRLAANEEKFEGIVNGAEGHEEELGGKMTPSLRTLFVQLSSGAFQNECVQRACACAKHWALQANKIATEDAVIATGSTEARTLPDRFADVVNVRDFGAKGDGVTDDTTAFSLVADNKIFVPKGSFKVSELPKMDNLYGHGELLYKESVFPVGDIDTIEIIYPLHFDSFEKIFKYIFSRNIKNEVVIKVEQGTYILNSPISINHPNGNKIKIIGSGSETTRLVFSNLGAAERKAGIMISGNYSIGLIDGLTLDGNEYDGHSDGGPHLGSGHENDPKGIFCENGATIKLGNDVKIYKFARNGVFAYNGGNILCDNVIVEECGGDAFVASLGSSIRGINIQVKNNFGDGVYSELSSSVVAENIICSGTKSLFNGSGGQGLIALNDGSITCKNANVSNTSKQGIYAVTGGEIFSNSCICSNCGMSGVYPGIEADKMGYIYADNSIIKQSSGPGIKANSKSCINSNSCEVTYNSGNGIEASLSSFINIENILSEYNHKNGISATERSYINARSMRSVYKNKGFGLYVRTLGVIDVQNLSIESVVIDNEKGLSSGTIETGTLISDSFILSKA